MGHVRLKTRSLGQFLEKHAYSVEGIILIKSS